MNLAGIKIRLLLLGIVPSTLLITSLSYYFIQYHYIDLENSLKNKGKITINQLATSSIHGILSGNSKVLHEITNDLLNDPDIALIEITDSLGNSLTHSEQTPLPSKNQLIFLQHPVTVQSIKPQINKTLTNSLHHSINEQKKPIGSVKIALSLVDTQKKKQIYLLNSLLLICSGIVFTILLSIHLSNSINSAIIKLINTTNDLADDNINAHPMKSTISEFYITTVNSEKKNKLLEKSPPSAITQTKPIDLDRTSSEIPKKPNSCSIFIADDNEINRLLLKYQLEAHCKQITLAKDGKKALYLLQQEKYDLIFLDLQMPYFSGQELIKTIKQADSVNKNSPVVAITAHALSHQRQIIIEAGFDECLIKPVLLEQLKEIVDLWLPEETFCLKNETDMADYVKAMLNKTSGNIELATTLFSKLFVELQQQSETIEYALNSNDMFLAEQVIHKLHGSVSFCGFTDIQEIARTLETSLSDNNPQLINTRFLALKNKIIDFIELKESILNQLT